jgi:hypothetical protein
MPNPPVVKPLDSVPKTLEPTVVEIAKKETPLAESLPKEIAAPKVELKKFIVVPTKGGKGMKRKPPMLAPLVCKEQPKESSDTNA